MKGSQIAFLYPDLTFSDFYECDWESFPCPTGAMRFEVKSTTTLKVHEKLPVGLAFFKGEELVESIPLRTLLRDYFSLSSGDTITLEVEKVRTSNV